MHNGQRSREDEGWEEPFLGALEALVLGQEPRALTASTMKSAWRSGAQERHPHYWAAEGAWGSDSQKLPVPAAAWSGGIFGDHWGTAAALSSELETRV